MNNTHGLYKSIHFFGIRYKFAVMILLSGLSLGCPLVTFADNSNIRQSLAENFPQFEKIEEIRKTPIAGIFEIRLNGTDIFYTDEKGDYLIQGNLIDVKKRRNLTEERLDQLTAIKFEDLPLKDAFTVVRGNGQRRLVVFEDPASAYCRKFESILQNVDNLTVHVFLLPMLGKDSDEYSKNIWCSKDRRQTWMDWMLRAKTPASATCDTTALMRNVEFGKKIKIVGTPTLVFANGSRISGIADAQQIEKKLAAIN